MTRQIISWLVFMLVWVGQTGCTAAGYYTQAAVGQGRILLTREPVEAVLADPATPAKLRQQIATALAITAFAESAIGLPLDDRYTTFVETGRDAVVYNVVAAPEFSLEPLRWCYPIVGCVPYRGYFRRDKAEAEASKLRAEGYDVLVGGVAAYSTLGWFRDPLMDTFIHWPEGQLANLLIHELTHGKVWVEGDAVFNESLASFVGDAGALQWLADKSSVRAAYVESEAAESAFTSFIEQLRRTLDVIYAGAADQGAKRLQRSAAIDAWRACYRRHRDVLGGGRYDNTVATRLNNAFLASRRTYDRYLPAFARLFEASAAEWPRFFAEVDRLAKLPQSEREAMLTGLQTRSGGQQVTSGGTDESADAVQCKPLSRQLSGEPQPNQRKR
jgi:predicted aminopeptidase